MAAKEKAAEGKKQEEDEEEDQEPEHNDQSIKQGDEKDETDWNHWTTEDVAKNAQLSDEGLEVLKKEKIRGAHLDQLRVSQLPSLPLGDKMNLTNLITKHKKKFSPGKVSKSEKEEGFSKLDDSVRDHLNRLWSQSFPQKKSSYKDYELDHFIQECIQYLKKKSITFDVKNWAQKRALNISGYQKKKEVPKETRTIEIYSESETEQEEKKPAPLKPVSPKMGNSVKLAQSDEDVILDYYFNTYKKLEIKVTRGVLTELANELGGNTVAEIARNIREKQE